jgi:hypothetical protein
MWSPYPFRLGLHFRAAVGSNLSGGLKIKNLVMGLNFRGGATPILLNGKYGQGDYYETSPEDSCLYDEGP